MRIRTDPSSPASGTGIQDRWRPARRRSEPVGGLPAPAGGRRAPGTPSLDLSYVVPLRVEAADDLGDLVGYLGEVSRYATVTVVDGSEPAVFARNLGRWPPGVRALPPWPWPGRNRKVAGVVTGVAASPHEFVIVADDDVRYSPMQLVEMCARLADADVVRPQNFFSPAPWHARWDTARSLLNRALSVDHPGTFGLRRSTFVRAGGYQGDVLFENLQMVRTLLAAGGREDDAPDYYVARRPPTAGKFLEQRVRQAYDDLGQPLRLGAEALLLPVLVGLARRPRRLALFAAGTALLAETGRRRGGGASVFPATAAGWAPVWVAERSVTVWLALLARCRGGVRYRGTRMARATAPARGAPEDMRRLLADLEAGALAPRAAGG